MTLSRLRFVGAVGVLLIALAGMAGTARAADLLTFDFSADADGFVAFPGQTCAWDGGASALLAANGANGCTYDAGAITVAGYTYTWCATATGGATALIGFDSSGAGSPGSTFMADGAEHCDVPTVATGDGDTIALYLSSQVDGDVAFTSARLIEDAPEPTPTPSPSPTAEPTPTPAPTGPLCPSEVPCYVVVVGVDGTAAELTYSAIGGLGTAAALALFLAGVMTVLRLRR